MHFCKRFKFLRGQYYGTGKSKLFVGAAHFSPEGKLFITANSIEANLRTEHAIGDRKPKDAGAHLTRSSDQAVD